MKCHTKIITAVTSIFLSSVTSIVLAQTYPNSPVGAINNVPIGNIVRNTGAFTTLDANIIGTGGNGVSLTTGQDGASDVLNNLVLRSWNGIGITPTDVDPTQPVPSGSYGIIFNSRTGSISALGNGTFGGNLYWGSSKFTTSGTTAILDTGGVYAALSTTTPIAAGGSGVTLNDNFVDVNGNTYLASAVTAGVVTAIQMLSTYPTFITPSVNPIALTDVTTPAGTGVQVNLTWSTVTSMELNPSGNTSVANNLTVGGVTVINNSTNINSYLGIGNNTHNGTMTLDGPTANARWIGLQDTGYDRWQIALDGTTSYNATANWAISVAYTINTVVNNLGNAYKVTTAGTSAASGTGPSGTGTAITDGTVVWTYLGPANTGDNFVLWAWDDPSILRTSPFSITRSTLQGYFSYGLYVSDYFNTTSANAGSVTITPIVTNATKTTSNGSQVSNTLDSYESAGGTNINFLENNKLVIHGAPTSSWWVGTDQLQYSGTGGGGSAGHVARYAQTTRWNHNAGGTANNPQLWGMVSESDDFTGVPSSQTNAQLSMEFDLTGHGIDDANNRQNQVVVIRPAADNTNYFEVNSGVGIVMNTGGYVKRALGVGGSFTTTALDFRYARSFEPNAISLSTNTGTYVTVTTAVTSSVTIPVSNVMPFTSDFIGRDINTGFTNTIFFSDGQSASETGYAITGTGPTPTGTITVSVAISEAAGNYVFNNSRTIWLGSNMNISLDDNGIVNLFGDGTNAHITAPLTIPTLNLAAANGSASYSQIYVDSAANTYNNDVVFRTGPSGTYHYTIIDQSGNLNVPAIVTVNSGYFDASHTTNAFAWAIGPNNVPLRAVNAAGNASYNLLILSPSNAAFVASDPAITGISVGNGTSSITLGGPIFAADTTTTPGGKQPLCIDTTTKQIYMGNGGAC